MVSVLIALVLGVAGNAIWAGIERLASGRVAIPDAPHVRIAAILQLFYFILIALVGVFIGRLLERGVITTDGLLSREKITQSKAFVLEVEGTKPLDGEDSDWQFFLTNCTTRILRCVELYNIKSEIGAYLIGFQEIPVMQPGQKIRLTHKVFPRRHDEAYRGKRPTLWDFGTDHAGERGNSYIWYDIYIEYREAEDDTVRNGGFVGVCFDLSGKKLKTEGAEYYRQDRYA